MSRLYSLRATELEAALEDYYARIDAGETVDPASFAASYGSLAPRIVSELHLDEAVAVAHAELEDEGWPAVGEAFDGYTIDELFAEGRDSRVYAATENNVGLRPVVIKVSAEPTAETRMIGQLGYHEKIVPVQRAGLTPQGLPYIAMPDLGRLTLRDLLLAGPVPSRVAYEAVRDIAEALAHAHSRGIVHGDIKPENVLVDEHNGHFRVLDFDLSSDSGRSKGGTQRYMPPEQDASWKAGSRPPAMPAGDMYSMGVLLKELIDSGSSRRAAMARGLERIARNCSESDPIARPTLPKIHSELRTLTRPYRRPVRSIVDRREWVVAVTAASVLIAMTTGPAVAARAPRLGEGLRLAVSRLSTGDLGAARSALALSFSKGSTMEDRLAFAWLLVRDGRPHDAVALLTDMLTRTDDGRVAAAFAYCCYEVNSSADVALEMTDRAIAAGFDNGAIRHNRAAFLVRLDRTTEALDDLLLAARSDPGLEQIGWTRLELELRDAIKAGTTVPSGVVATVEPAAYDAKPRQRLDLALASVLSGKNGLESMESVVSRLEGLRLKSGDLTLARKLWPEIAEHPEFARLESSLPVGRSDRSIELADPFYGSIPGAEPLAKKETRTK